MDYQYIALKTAAIVLFAYAKTHWKINDLTIIGVCGGQSRNKVENGGFCGRVGGGWKIVTE